MYKYIYICEYICINMYVCMYIYIYICTCKMKPSSDPKQNRWMTMTEGYHQTKEKSVNVSGATLFQTEAYFSQAGYRSRFHSQFFGSSIFNLFSPSILIS